MCILEYKCRESGDQCKGDLKLEIDLLFFYGGDCGGLGLWLWWGSCAVCGRDFLGWWIVIFFIFC